MRIENHCQNLTAPVIAKFIHQLLKTVPKEHVVGLEAIVLVDEVTDKASRKRGARGLYWQQWQERPATIEIVPSLIYRGMPSVFLYLPFFAKFALANVLYHELGHHYHQRFSHGVKETKSQNFADEYKAQMLRRAFFWWLFVALPLWRFIRWLNALCRKMIGKRGR